jgi:hypothetical protein
MSNMMSNEDSSVFDSEIFSLNIAESKMAGL